MNNATAAPESATPTKTAIRLATAFGLGYAPVAPGTAGSLGGVGIFALLLFTLEGVALDLAFIAVSLCLVATAMWSSERCRLIDLGNWASEKYKVSEPAVVTTQPEDMEPENHEQRNRRT